jgi:hypothetical protein
VLILTRAVSGVISEGFITIVQPAANAGATFQALGASFSQVSESNRYHSPHVDRIIPGNSYETDFKIRTSPETETKCIYICPQTPIGSCLVKANLVALSTSID